MIEKFYIQTQILLTKIKKSKIRGVASQGMICSVRELELGEEHDGIWVLPESAEVGRPVAEALAIGNDDVLLRRLERDGMV